MIKEREIKKMIKEIEVDNRYKIKTIEKLGNKKLTKHILNNLQPKIQLINILLRHFRMFYTFLGLTCEAVLRNVERLVPSMVSF